MQSILIKHEMGARHERLLKLEERHAKGGIELSAEQIKLIEKANPSFAERHVEHRKASELVFRTLSSASGRHQSGLSFGD